MYIPSEHIPRQTRMLFALQMKFHHTELWDNNNGANYEIVPERLMQICLPTSNKDNNGNNGNGNNGNGGNGNGKHPKQNGTK